MTPPASPYGHNFTTITGSPVYNITGFHGEPALHLWPYVTFAYNAYGHGPFKDTIRSYQTSPKHADVIEPKTPVLPHRQSPSYHYGVYDLSRTMNGKRPVGRVLFPSDVTEGNFYFLFYLTLYGTNKKHVPRQNPWYRSQPPKNIRI